ncbi:MULTISPECIES: hypothetical protein [Wolbachia]|nr:MULTISPECIES: hypothetical protein [Wolbachia]
MNHTHKRKLIKTDTESREKSTDNLTLESKATAQLHGDINKDSELIFETNKKAQNALPEEEPDGPSPTELYFDSKENSADEKSSIQPIVAGVVGAVLLVSCVASYLLIEYSKVHVIAVIGGIVGLVCMGFAMYNAIKPNTKLERVDEQSITAHPPLKII